MSFTVRPEAGKDAGTAGHLWTKVNASGVEYLRLPLHTRWLDETDDLTLALKENLALAKPGDTVAISEKVAILLTGRTVDIQTVRPGRLARFLAAHVHPRTDSQGHCWLPPDHRCGGQHRGDSAVRHAWNVLPYGRICRPGCRRRTTAVRACALPAFRHQSRTALVRRSRACAGHRRKHR